ncbi:MAG: biotin synthase BioB, partial [Planctomycetota bacterium]
MPPLRTPQDYLAWAEAGLNNTPISREDAHDILCAQDVELLPLLHAAGTVRRHYHGDTVAVHILDNVQNGACPEDCGYCGQSKDSDAPIAPYKLKPVDAIVADARHAQQQGAFRFCMALSGRGPSDADIEHMGDAISQIRSMGLRTCLSAGLMDRDKAQRLKDAGLDRLNHNLNTSEDHYGAICTTHTYRDRLDTLTTAKSVGLSVCSGLIVGMGETIDDLLDIAYALRDLRSESIPVNFLLPIEGNRVNDPVSNGRPLNPEYCLRVLCVMRLVNPDAEIRVAAGREHHFRSLQPLSLQPANSLFMDGYLLTQGQDAGDTLRMILDAGFKPELETPEIVPQ